jgi:hypothetical protein
VSHHRPPEPHPGVLVIGRPIADGDLRLLCERLDELVARGGCTDVVCDAGALAPDAVSVDALARLCLEGKRRGCRVRLCNVPVELGRLLSFLGLAGAVGLGGLEAQRQAEQREEPRRVEERVDRGDLPT